MVNIVFVGVGVAFNGTVFDVDYTGGDGIYKGAIVGNKKDGAGVLLESLAQGFDGLKIEMVGGFVE